MSGLWTTFLNHTGRVANKWNHYFPVYQRHFAPFVDRPVTVLEIGCGEGGSLQLWRRHFGPRANIVGIDNRAECRAFEEDHIHVRIGDQADATFLGQVVEEFGAPDVVIDDGCHLMGHVVASFDALYPRIPKGGVYLVEDLHTAYWDEYGGGLRRDGTFVEQAKAMVDRLNADWTRGALPADEFTRTTLSVHFYDSVIVCEKGSCGHKGAPRIGNRLL